MMEYILPALVLLPFIAGIIAYFAEGRSPVGEAGKTVSGEGLKIPAVKKGFLVSVLFMAMEAALLFFAIGGSASGQGILSGGVLLRNGLPGVCGFGLYFQLDGFRLLYGSIAVFMWLITTLVSGEYFEGHRNTGRFYLFLFWTLGATLGVFLSADLITLFLFFEIMSFTSYTWVAQEENAPALRAAETYLGVAVTGGLVMLMGIFLVYHAAGDCGLYRQGEPLYFEALRKIWDAPRFAGSMDVTDVSSRVTDGSAQILAENSGAVAGLIRENFGSTEKGMLWIAGFCMLFGFGAKAGAFPLHIWLPKAHPVAPAPASALLSGILTKTGIYGTLILSCQFFFGNGAWGSVCLLLGLITMFAGAVLAVFSVDLKRTLACSSVSQIGFIFTGIGMQGLLGEENALAVHGTMLHMVNHSLIKLLLFLTAGVVYKSAHSLDLNKIRGWGRKKPLAKVIFLTGALAIGGIPLFGGYASKTLLHEAIVEYGGSGLMTAAEWLFLFSGGLTVAYMTKLFVAIFVEKNADAALQERYDGQRQYNSRERYDGKGQYDSRERYDGQGRYDGQRQNHGKERYMDGTTGAALTVSAVVLFLWGLLPGVTMDRAAELSQRFFGLSEYGHKVAYFSLENLKGALISIAIGAIVYLFFIRTLLMRRETVAEKGPLLQKGEVTGAELLMRREDTVGKVSSSQEKTVAGKEHSAQKKAAAEKVSSAQEKAAAEKKYVDAWPKWLDLENLLYRPLLLKILPAIFGVLCRILDSFADTLVVLLRKSVYRDSPLPHERTEGNVVTEMIGKFLNAIQRLGNRTWNRKDPKNVDYEHVAAARNRMFQETNVIIGRSLSFGLFLFGIGLALTLIYLVWY